MDIGPDCILASALTPSWKPSLGHFPERRVFVVWDDLNIHHDGKDRCWSDFSRRHRRRFRFVYTPLHASWMNQIEIWFSILHRRLLRYGSFVSIDDLRDQVLAFIRYWNRFEAHPFD
jgi:transposase